VSDGTLIKMTETVAELRPEVIPARKFMPLKDRDGKEYDINTDRIVFISAD